MGPTVVEIYHKNFIHNINLIQENAGKSKVMAVVKANAYGHGSIEIARSAIKTGCEYLGVAFVEEGIELREAGITVPVLVFGAHSAEQLKIAAQNNLEITITSLKQISELEKIADVSGLNFNIHLKIDTGMGRVGFHLDQINVLFKKIYTSDYLKLKGIYSHFSTADEQDETFARLQISRFNKVKHHAIKIFKTPILFHMANSAAIMKFPESYFDMVRPGIMLYGCLPGPEFPLLWDLKQVMKFKTRIGLIKTFEKDQPVSYGRRYFTPKKTNIAVLPVGYADGYSRKNTNIASVTIDSKNYPVVGTVCMDMIMVDLGENISYTAGKEVVLYNTDRNLNNSIDKIAGKLGTIGYEITCNVSKRVQRIHIYD